MRYFLLVMLFVFIPCMFFLNEILALAARLPH